MIVTLIICNQSVRAQIFESISLTDAQLKSNPKDVSISLNSNDAPITFSTIAWSQANELKKTFVPESNKNYISQTQGCKCKKRGWGCGIGSSGCEMHCRAVCGPHVAENNLSIPESETLLSDVYPAIVPIK